MTPPQLATSTSDVDPQWLAAQIEDRSARGIAATVAALIRAGAIPPGTRLPTVRALGLELGVSPATVSEAWSLLRRRRSVAGRGRAGTVVTGPPDVPHPRRFEEVGRHGDRLLHDLRLAVPDTALLPPLDAALSAALRVGELNEYHRVPITERLADAVRPTWPFPPASLLAVNGGFDGLLLLCQALVVTGDTVAVEDPTAPRLLDILDAVGAEVIPVPCDGRGPRPDALADAVRRKPVLFIYQPHAHSPTGHSVDPARSAELAAALSGSETLVVEDDGMADLAPGPVQTLGTVFPDRVVFLRSYSKSHGPDLRLAVLGGAAALIERARVYRTFGSGWTSRILQNCLAHLLNDPHTRALVTETGETYRARRRTLAAALAARGVRTGGTEGLSLWMPVEDERSALVTLAAHGVAVVPGGRYFSGPHKPFLRVATSRLHEHVDEVADLLAFAAFEEHDRGQPTIVRG
ncbi:HTH-type transcriptional regulator TauR [Micromonospora sp. MH33]|uniref:aminotransferase-like domain-containing protein n=1 Tax=Micromonospora sp. MH33 TaxID=1945509 RepID=UPI000D14A9B6|nr:PLP-dependent aminotransferase family protein [Micromonospora sp. MH33]PSK67508.1 HTH-type transcriptional regulator TauR [Micromonospora sp. MH33]